MEAERVRPFAWAARLTHRGCVSFLLLLPHKLQTQSEAINQCPWAAVGVSGGLVPPGGVLVCPSCQVPCSTRPALSSPFEASRTASSIVRLLSDLCFHQPDSPLTPVFTRKAQPEGPGPCPHLKVLSPLQSAFGRVRRRHPQFRDWDISVLGKDVFLLTLRCPQKPCV